MYTQKFARSTHIELIQERDIPEITRFDERYFGAPREKILAAHLTSNPEKAFITRGQSGEIAGYIFADDHFIGPWIAETLEDAEKLLNHTLALPFVNGPHDTLPSSNQRGVDYRSTKH